MGKQVLILAGSPRKKGNSAMLCQEFARGAQERGHQVETVFLADKTIGYCHACYHCQKNGVCILKDDMAELLEKIHAADVLVMASPLECFRGFARCLEGSVERGVIYGKGVYGPGEILGKPAMQEAYVMGKNV